MEFFNKDSICDKFGELQHGVGQQLNIFWDSNPMESGEHTFHTHQHESNQAEQDWKSLRSTFGWNLNRSSKTLTK